MDFVKLIHNDVCSIICKFLDPKDILTLCLMYPKILKKVNSVYQRRIGEHIDAFFRETLADSFPEFRNQMISSDAMLSGSLIIQKALGVRWPGHSFNRLDVDIFVRVDPIYTPEQILDHHKPILDNEYTFYNYDHKFKLGYTGLHKFLYSIIDHNNGFNGYETESQYKDELGDNVILRVNNYVIKDENMFQLVEINKAKHPDYQHFIDETVDFDICKNLFRYTDAGFEIRIENLEQIINRETEYNYVHDQGSSLKRRDKYTKRGFKFN